MSVPRVRPRHLSVLAILALLWSSLIVTSSGASYAGAVKGSLAVISVADQGTGLTGAVAGRPFNLVVEARDPLGAPLAPTQNTRVRLSLVTGSGALAGVVEGTIAKGTTRGTIAGATYAPFGNAVTLGAAVVSGTAL